MDVGIAIDRAGGVVALANMLGVDHTAVVKWRKRNKIPAARVPDVARITGIPRHELRPDLWEAPDGVAS